MKARSQKLEIRGQQRRSVQGLALAAVLLLPWWAVVSADQFAALCADRTAIERVYYNHRTGTQPPFEETLPAEQVRLLVQTDLAKEAALKNVYGVEVAPAMLAPEVQRINTTTRAPDILAELKAALDYDTNRFARTVAKPIVVERLLRNRFENDDKLHAPQRRQAEQVRNELLTAKRAASAVSPPHPALSPAGGEGGPATAGPGEEDARLRDRKQFSAEPATTNALVAKLLAVLKQRHSNAVTETTWQLGARTPDTDAPAADELEIKKRFGPDAQLLSSPRGAENDRKFYFEDLPGDLQRVLRVQLRQPGDVSAVIETPGGFLLYVCKERTAATLSVAALSLPKRSYEQWLAEQNGAMK